MKKTDMIKKAITILMSAVCVGALTISLMSFDCFAAEASIDESVDATAEDTIDATVEETAGEAENGAISGELIMIDEDLAAMADKTSSEPVTTFEAGSYIYVTAQDDDWYEIYYRGETLYAPKAGSKTETFDAGAVTMEMMSEQVKSEAHIMDYQAQLKAHRAGIIWKVLIIMIIAGAVSVPGVMALTKR